MILVLFSLLWVKGLQLVNIVFVRAVVEGLDNGETITITTCLHSHAWVLLLKVVAVFIQTLA